MNSKLQPFLGRNCFRQHWVRIKWRKLPPSGWRVRACPLPRPPQASSELHSPSETSPSPRKIFFTLSSDNTQCQAGWDTSSNKNSTKVFSQHHQTFARRNSKTWCVYFCSASPSSSSSLWLAIHTGHPAQPKEAGSLVLMKEGLFSFDKKNIELLTFNEKKRSSIDEKKDGNLRESKKKERWKVEYWKRQKAQLTILLSSSSYARHGNTAVRIPEVWGSIAGPARFTNSLISYFDRIFWQYIFYTYF